MGGILELRMYWVKNRFCNHLTILPIQKKECLFLLDHIQDIINWIMQGISPGDICVKLGFC